jgi:hypothetical protein
MASHRRKLEAGLAAFLAFSLFVCVAPGGASARAPGRQIEFTPHVTDVGATPIPGATLVPTLGAGQYFTEDSLPPVTRPDLLGDAFGYSEILGQPGLYLVWSTDEEGNTHYATVAEGNPALAQIRALVDAHRQAALELHGQSPLVRFGIGLGGGAFFSLLTLACGVGTGASLMAEPVSAPLTAVLAGCTGGSFLVAREGFGAALDAFDQLNAFALLTEETRRAVEGQFIQLPYLP